MGARKTLLSLPIPPNISTNLQNTFRPSMRCYSSQSDAIFVPKYLQKNTEEIGLSPDIIEEAPQELQLFN